MCRAPGPSIGDVRDVSVALERTGDGQITVISRETMRRAEVALRWREADVLDFSRLTVLARRAHVGRLVVGWIPLFVLNPETRNRSLPSGGAVMGRATVIAQIFDLRQGRLVWQIRESGRSPAPGHRPGGGAYHLDARRRRDIAQVRAG